jgi:small-conductance mechanosensitive channel
MRKNKINKKMIFLFFIESFFAYIIFFALVFSNTKYSQLGEWSRDLLSFITMFILIIQLVICLIVYYLTNIIYFLKISNEYIFFVVNMIIYVFLLFVIDKNFFKYLVEKDQFIARNYFFSYLLSTIITLTIYFFMRSKIKS